MDSLTQIVLGAAIAEKILGKKVGNKAPLWGAVCGTIPDLDVLLNPFLSDLQELGSHRGFSHSILFSVLLAPLLGYLLSALYRKKEAKWYEWALLCFASLVTHPLLDAFTNYGTQLFLPFSNYRVAFNSIFVVDPLYTLPMMVLLMIAMFLPRQSSARTRLNTVGMMISHLYLAFTVANKCYVGSVVESSLRHKNLSYSRYYTNPMPLQNILWYCVAEDSAGFYVGNYSWMDKDPSITFRYVSKNDKGLENLKQSFALRRLHWFSNGYYVFTRDNGNLYVNDMRFGKGGVSFNDKAPFIFSWQIVQEDGKIEIKRNPAPFKWSDNAFSDLLDRIQGIKRDSL